MTTRTANEPSHAMACTTSPLEQRLRLIAGTVVTTSVLLGLLHSQAWFYLTLFAGVNLFQSGVTNWCPMMVLLRRAGLR